MTRPTRTVIDLQALQTNLRQARAAAPRSKVMAVIKADGYGHGLERVARALADADAFAVASVEEAVRLRESGVTRPITLLEGCFEVGELAAAAHYGLAPVVHHDSQLAALEAARPERPLAVWLKIDSGMHRLGFAPGEARAVAQRLAACAAVARVDFLSHLACADDRRDRRTGRQREVFLESVAGLPGERSLANSAGVLGWPDTHLDWVRPGIMLYGVSPFLGGRGLPLGLRPAMTFTSRLIAVNRRRRGDAVGYGGSWVCPEDMPVGVVACGYGDGYPRHAKPGTPVLVNGRRVALIGRVSMDMLCVDLRSQPDAQVGDAVQLWGTELPVEEIAEHAQTIAYELLCGITGRVAVDVREPLARAAAG